MSKKDFNMYVHNGPKLERTQLSLSKTLNIQMIIFSHNGVLLRNKNNMEESQKHSLVKRLAYIRFDSIYGKF